jgi:hypothetical protein
MYEEDLEQIRTLIEEENKLRAAGHPANPEKLRHLEEALDQAWDLLRQRRALHEFGDDENLAHERDPSTVERYLQ